MPSRIAAFLAALIGGAVAGYFLGSSPPSRTVAESPLATAPASTDGLSARVAELEKSLAGRNKELASLRKLLDAEQARNLMLDDSPASSASPAAAAAPATNQPLAQLLQALGPMLTNQAAMRSMGSSMRRDWMARGRLYDDFIDEAGLTGDQARELQRLLEQRRRMRMAGAWFGEEEARRMGGRNDERIQELLGSNYERLASYEAEMPAREFVEGFAAYLEDKHSSLDRARKAALVTTLMRNVPGIGSDRRGGAFPPGQGQAAPKSFDEAIERSVDMTVQRYDQIVANAKPVLSEGEFQALDEYLGERMQQREMGAQMAKTILPTIFGSNAPPFLNMPGVTTDVQVITGPAEGE